MTEIAHQGFIPRSGADRRVAVVFPIPHGRIDERGAVSSEERRAVYDNNGVVEDESNVLTRTVHAPDGRLTPYIGVGVDQETQTEAGVSDSKYDCFVTKDPVVIQEARRLVADRYLQLGFIQATDIDENGVMTAEADPYAKDATYYVLTDPETHNIVATSRTIHYSAEKGDKSFPLWDHKDELDPESVKRIEEIGLERLVEIASLVRNPAYKPDRQITMQLYRKMIQDFWAEGPDKVGAFFMACKPSLFRNFKIMFDGSVGQIGPQLDYPGEPVIPAMFEMQKGTLNLIHASNLPLYKNRHNWVHGKVVSFMMDGLKHDAISPDIVDALYANGFQDVFKDTAQANQQEKTGLRQALEKRKPEIIGGTALLAYTAARTVAVAKAIDPGTHVSWEAFLAIEAGTTAPYVYGIGDLVRSISKPEDYSKSQRVRAALLAGGSFIAPYAYLAAEGQGMSDSAWAGMAAFVLYGVAEVRKKVKKAKQLRQQLPVSDGQVDEISPQND